MFRYGFLAICLFPFEAMACDYCALRVTLNKPLAECYLERVDQEIARMESASLPAQLINLSVCGEVQEKSRGTNGLPTPFSEAPEINYSFLLDKALMLCLKEELGKINLTEDDVITIDIGKTCD